MINYITENINSKYIALLILVYWSPNHDSNV